MTHTHHLSPSEWVKVRPFTHPDHIDHARSILCYMAGQVSILLAYPYLSSEPPHTVFFNRPDNGDWFHRIVLSAPEQLRETRPLTTVGFFGQKQEDADGDAAHEFDRLLVAEIPEHPGLLSYSTVALDNGNYANLVLFSDGAARDHWGASQAHAQAVRQLAPSYYQTVTIYNGRLPQGIGHYQNLTLIRAKYYDYQCRPHWRAVREIAV